MTVDQDTRLLRALRSLEKQQREIDFGFAKWAKDLRAVCKSDSEFLTWCQERAGYPLHRAEAMLKRVAVIGLVSDEPSWDKLGGYEKIQPLVTHDLPRKEQIAIIEAAKASGYSPKAGPITRIMQQRGHLPPPAPVRSTAHLPVIATPTAHEIERLARFIDETYKNPPPDIRRIVSKYTATARTGDKVKADTATA